MVSNFFIIKNTIVNITGIILFRIVLDLNYATIISPLFISTGFVDESNAFSMVLSWITLLILAPFIISIYKTPKLSANIIVLLFLVFYVPMTSIMRFIPMDTKFQALFMIYWIILLTAYILIPSFKLSKEAKRNSFALWFVLLILSVSVIYVSGRYFGFRIHFGLMDVYDLRNEERSLNLPIILKYLLPAAANILPVLLVYFLFKRKILIAILISFVILLNFSIGGHKDVIFKLVLCFIGYWLYNRNRIVLFSWGLSLISFLSLIEFYFTGTFFIANVAIRRVFYIPALLNYNYYNYFTIHEPDYFRQGIIGWLGISSPYKVPIAKIIGYDYSGNIDTNANNGLFSDAYLNFNVLGVLIFPVILIVIFKLFDFCSKGLDPKLWILPIVAAVISFGSSPFTTVLLTNGILLLLITLYFMPRSKISFIQ